MFLLVTVAVLIIGSPEGVTSPVIINEIHYHPPNGADADEEFLELYNRTDSEVDLDGWVLRDGVQFRFDGSSGPASVPPKGFLVVARNPQGLARITKLEASRIAGPYEGKLSNFKDRIVLADAEGREVEVIAYSQDGPWPARADGLGASLERVSSEVPGNLPQNWKVSSGRWAKREERVIFENGAKVRWFENLDGTDPGFAGGLPWYHLDFEDAANGWRDGRLAVGYDTHDRRRQGWIQTDATARSGLHSILLRITFQLSEDASKHEIPCLDMDWDDGFIAWLNGVEIARRGMTLPPGTAPPTDGSYGAEVVEAVRDKEKEPHYRRLWRGSMTVLRRGRNVLAIGNYNANARSSDLFATARLVLVPGGAYADFSPGAPNSVAAPAAPPLVTFLKREPEEPRPADSVSIRAHVEGEDVKEVVLSYDTGSGERSVSMHDDGRDPDRVAKDGIYSAQIPPAPDGTVVRFRLEARDSAGLFTRFPREGNPSADLGYYVLERPPPGNEDLDIYHLLWTGPLSCTKGKWRQHATFVHRGTAYLDVRLKYRGDTSCGDPKTGLRVAFNKGDLFRRQKRLNFLACWQDKAVLRELLAWDLYRDMGHSHCRARMAAVYAAGNRFHGLFITLEDPTESYLRRNGLDPGGTVWKCRSSLRDGSTTSYEKQTAREDPTSWEKLAGLGSVLNSLEGKELVEFLLKNVDVESVIEYQTVKCLTSDEDGYTKNWLLYHGRCRDQEGRVVERWAPHPWDVDLSFGQINLGDDRVYTTKHPLMGTQDHARHGREWNGLIEAMFGRRAGNYFVKALYGRISRSVEEKFHPAILGAKIDRIDRNTIELARRDLTLWPRWGSHPTDPDYHRRRLKDYVTARWRFLRDFLESEKHTSLSVQGDAASPLPREPYRKFRYKSAPRMKITKIHYHPAANEELEFIEIRNLEKVLVDISGWNIPAVGYVFPEGSRAPADACFVVARNPERFAAAHGKLDDLKVFGPYPGNLSNGGEDLRLRDSGWYQGKKYFPESIDVVKYDDRNPWPDLADGAGASLELRDLSLDNDHGWNWDSSREKGGSPGSLRR